MPLYLDKPLHTPAAWRGTDWADNNDWMIALQDDHVEALSAAAQDLARQGRSHLNTTAADFALPSLAQLGAQLQQRLEGGPGFALLRGLPVDACDEATSTLMFWGLGTHIGAAEPQDAAGNLLHHVRDTGDNLERKSDLRAYQTNRAINYHNDGADLFALLCLQQAGQGGGSRLVSAVAVFNEILRRKPALARLLQEPFYFDARGQQLPGAPPYQHVPIFNYHLGFLNVLYKREYIDLARRFDELPPLNRPQVEALDLMDAVCDELAFEFALHPGDILVANNCDLLHARSAFQDPGGAQEGRHMLRLWLTLPQGRPLPPVFARTREFCHSYRRRHAHSRQLQGRPFHAIAGKITL